MRNGGSTGGKSCLSGLFTLRGKPRTVARGEPSRLKAIGAAFLLASAEPAAARPQIGPTSSTSIRISLSVAPQYRLATDDPSLRTLGLAGEGGRSCLATNGQPTVLPVLLVRMNAAQTGSAPTNEPAERITWCESDNEARPTAGRAVDRGQSGPLMIRPE